MSRLLLAAMPSYSNANCERALAAVVINLTRLLQSNIIWKEIDMKIGIIGAGNIALRLRESWQRPDTR
jgi:hypothetical protein